MQLYVRIIPDLPAGGPYAHMNPGHDGDPFGVIEFGDNAYVSVKTDDEARRIIAVAAALIEMRKRVGAPHEFEPSTAGSVTGLGRCARCGMLEDWADHAALKQETDPPAPVIPCCEHCTPQCGPVGFRRSGHPEPCTTPGCPSAAPVITGSEAEPFPGPAWCPGTTFMEHEEVTLYCDRENGHPGSHHAPGPDEGSEVAWSDAPAEPEALIPCCECCTPHCPARETGHRTECDYCAAGLPVTEPVGGAA